MSQSESQGRPEWAARQAQVDALKEQVVMHALAGDYQERVGHTGGGNPPGGSDVSARLINLERDMTDVKVSLGRVETRLDHIEKNMLTKGQAAIYAMAALLAVTGGAWWVVQQYLAPILAALAG